VRRELGRPDLGAADRERLLAALVSATQLVEVLESVTFDCIRWLATLRAPS
jgi:hypothetical protein